MYVIETVASTPLTEATQGGRVVVRFNGDMLPAEQYETAVVWTDADGREISEVWSRHRDQASAAAAGRKGAEGLNREGGGWDFPAAAEADAVPVLALTARQWEAVADRLHLSDTLADCFASDHEPGPERNRVFKNTEGAAEMLADSWDGKRIDPAPAVERYGAELVREVLADCVNGSTWLYQFEDEGGLAFGRACRIADTAAARVSKAVGWPVEFPNS